MSKAVKILNALGFKAGQDCTVLCREKHFDNLVEVVEGLLKEKPAPAPKPDKSTKKKKTK
jgi:hypothetical protein